jgi:curved DNA-binding protein CbpA
VVDAVSETSLYELLGLTRTATDDEVRTAYRRTARRVHPDAGGSEHEFRRVHAAYRVLGDPGRRQAYDRRLARSAGANEGPAGRGYPASRPGGAVPGPDARARRWYFIAMAACIVLFALAGAVVRDYSVPVAMGMAMVAMVIPPIAAFAVNRPSPNR